MSAAPVPTDSEMLDAIRRAKHKLIQDLADGKGAKRVNLPGLTIEAQDTDKVLDKLSKLEEQYAFRAGGRQGFAVRP